MTSPEVEYIDIYPQDGSQYLMLTSSAEELFLGGESGGGKSFGFLLDFLEDIDRPAANGLFLRRHFTDLEGIIHDAIGLYRGYGAVFNEQKHLFTFPSGARLRMGHMNTVNDVYNYTGNQRTHYYWDELPQFPKMPYLLLMAWLRSTDDQIFKRIRASGNPDGVGLPWVKDRFIDKLEPFEKAWFITENGRDKKVPKGTPGAMSRQFLPCFREENLALMSKDPGYRDRLKQLPEDKQRAYLHGLWDSVDRPFQVVKSQWWNNAINGKNKPVPGLAAIGGDYAESGDKCAECQGFGNQVRKFKDYPGMDTDEFGDILFKSAMGLGDKHGHDFVRVGVDSVGPGTGVYHHLRKTKLAGRLDPMRYKDPAFDETWKTYTVKMRFNNLRSQMWWKFGDDMRHGRVDLSPLQNEEGYYENLHLLQEEILAHTYTEKNGIIQIVDKNELRKAEQLARSPDRADALVIWNWVRDKRPLSHIPEKRSLRQQLEERDQARKLKRWQHPASNETVNPSAWQAG